MPLKSGRGRARGRGPRRRLRGRRKGGDQRLGRGRGAEAEAGVAAGAEPAGGALQAVDEAAVDVAHLDAEAALAEIVAVRVGRLEAGEVEDAEVDRGDGGVGFFAGREAVDLEHRLGGAARRGFGGASKATARRRAAGVDGGPGEADGARRVAAGGDVHRADERRGDIGAGAPVVADGEVDDVLASLDREGAVRNQPVAHDGDEELAGVRDDDAGVGGVPGA